MDKIETDCIWVILKIIPRPERFSSLWQIAWIKKAVFAHNHLFRDVTIILSVKEFRFLVLNS